MKRTAIGYKIALRWILDNDDNDWLWEDDPIISVSAAFCADIYGRTNEEIIADLRKMDSL